MSGSERTDLESSDLAEEAVEQAGYLTSGEERLYYVLHGVARPRARILLAGPFASERPHSYIPWVRWARFLAARGVEALRFDYRGVGESTGAFEAMSFATWAEDVERMSRWLQERSPHVPLWLHGLGLGALLAAHVFQKGLGEGLLLWAAPASGNEVLREGLLRRMSMDYVTQGQGKRKTYEDYVATLQSGRSIEVEGYPWTKGLWEGAAGFTLTDLTGGPGDAGSLNGRPWKQVKLDQSKAPLVAGLGLWQALNPRSVVGKVALNPDFSEFFEANLSGLLAAGRSSEGGRR